MPRLHIHQRLNRHPKHRWSMLRNMTASLFMQERITTTDAKARALVGVVGRMFARAVKDTKWSQNKVTGLIRVKEANYKLYSDLVKRFRLNGGNICRLIHLHERRKGDGANMVMVELLKK